MRLSAHARATPPSPAHVHPQVRAIVIKLELEVLGNELPEGVLPMEVGGLAGMCGRGCGFGLPEGVLFMEVGG